MKDTRKKKNARRRNQGSMKGAEFPVGQVVDVEAIRINSDGTLDVFIEDAEIPRSLPSQNRRRNRKPAKKAKKLKKAKKAKKAKKEKRR